MTAIVSSLAVASNIFLMTETLPRIVEARRAKQLEDQGDVAAPLLAEEPHSEAADIEGLSGRLTNTLTQLPTHSPYSPSYSSLDFFPACQRSGPLL